MTSFGEETSTTSLRHSVSESALINWYKLLWNRMASQENNIIGVDDAILHGLDNELATLMHYHPRDDVAIVGAFMRVWGLCRAVQKKGFTGTLTFEETIHGNHDMDVLEDTIAFYMVGNIPKVFVPLEYQIPGPLQGDVEMCEINEQGILLLFARWHVKIMDQKLAIVTPPLITETEIGQLDGTLTAQNMKRLDAINGIVSLWPQDIYSNVSNMNIYARIKVSSLNADNQYNLSTSLFEFKPETYVDTLIGKTLLLSKLCNLSFCYGDEILWTSGKSIWLWYDAEVKLVSFVADHTTKFTTNASMQGLQHLHDYLMRESVV